MGRLLLRFFVAFGENLWSSVRRFDDTIDNICHQTTSKYTTSHNHNQYSEIEVFSDEFTSDKEINEYLVF
ncbi:hypothetical protein ASU31_25295 [Pedobacter ginsenosidimutans]|uniref:Uncharacterized protein n=1 Tax=Pedobacter ginsenosidimutans TaxID=687842 RepID=A0A0T5VHJ0_9SPHI|nr:hypothetical protein ASU31_25295 [Pedobacter ginsenosidimutans]